MLIRVPTCLEPVFLLVTITFVRMLAMERDKAYPACVTGNRLYAVLRIDGAHAGPHRDSAAR